MTDYEMVMNVGSAWYDCLENPEELGEKNSKKIHTLSMPPSATSDGLHQRVTQAIYSHKSQAPIEPAQEEDLKRTLKNSKEVWWINGVFVALAHAVALGTVVLVTPKWQTVVLMFVIVVLGELGITMGYHRLWSHRAYTASLPLRAVLAFMGTLGFQGSIKWWTLRHRLHHRYTDDSIHDPYSASRGFWFSHMGWIFEKPTYTRMSLVDASDLNADSISRIGSENKSFQMSIQREHHEFPKDYRNGVHALDWDPTKWLISLASRVGLASNLYMYPENEINKARVSTTRSKLAVKEARLDWGPDPTTLPIVSLKDSTSVTKLVGHDEWIVLDGFVLNVEKFKATHPGGEKLIEVYQGKDASKAFYGVLNNHSKSAKTMVEMLRIARVE
ncbi:UNVERIFIED_CONTAM: hypothetical protein HDU68_011792 [Siphonaria sp. JEL0065]|nr:hypothetical protein HDU68_011792 [Siphonaria sp. JEL0065]